MTQVYLLSDLHVNYAANWEWLSELCGYSNDILIIAGDISHDLGETKKCLQLLSNIFKYVFFTPGNHDFWVKKTDKINSLEKLDLLLSFCKSSGIKTKPEKVDGLWIVPLFSWYDSTLAGDDVLSPHDVEEMKGWSDYFMCRWPTDKPPITLFERNEQFLRCFDPSEEDIVLTFSHMVPRRDLLPPRHMLRHSFLPHVMGSTQIETALRRVGSCVHCYGHSHISMEHVIDGVRYAQNALGSPREREARGAQPRLLRVWPQG